MKQSKIDLIETLVLACAIHSTHYAVVVMKDLYNYPWGTNEKQVIASTIKTMLQNDIEVNPDDLIVEVNKKLLEKLNLTLGKISALIVTMIDKFNPVNLNKNILKLIDQRTAVDLGNMYSDLLSDLNNDVDIRKVISKNEERLFKIEIKTNDELVITQDEVVEEMIKEADSETKEEKVYLTGDRQIDDMLRISKRNVTMLAGKAGSYKTKFMIFILRSLLAKYDDISVLHYLMEDPADKAIRAYVAPKLLLQDEQMLEKGYKMTAEQKKLYKQYLREVKNYDVKYVNKGSSIFEIAKDYKDFRKRRKGRFNILVIDNIMKLAEYRKYVNNPVHADNLIAAEIDSWNIKTTKENACVFLLHHLEKSQQKEERKSSGYRPTEANVRGSLRFNDSVTQILLMNSIGNFLSVVDDNPHIRNIISRTTVIDLIKNRNNKLATLRYASFPEFSTFVDLNTLISKYK